MGLTEVKDKLLTSLCSAKLQIFAISTVLFYTGKLSENGWLMVAGLATGLRELVNIQSMRMSANGTTSVTNTTEVKSGTEQ